MGRVDQATATVQAKVAEPWESPEDFWAIHGKGADVRVAQIIGMDWTSWGPKHDVAGTEKWLLTLQRLMSSASPRMALTTIFVMAWPHELVPQKLGALERFRPLILAGAKLRHKTPEFYATTGSDFRTSFVRDLEAHGLLAPPAITTTGRAYRPNVDTEEEAENARARQGFYANPPFKWKPEEIRELFGFDEPPKKG